MRLRAEQTDGRLGLVEQVVPGGYPGPAMHVHPDFDETFYVIEGTSRFPRRRPRLRGVGRHRGIRAPGHAAHVRQHERGAVAFAGAGHPRRIRALLRGADRADRADGRVPARGGASRARDRARQHPGLTATSS